jgi:AcrR family transcriptional regulator
MDTKTAYHHGGLRDGLLAAAEAILRRSGLTGLTLRAIAREAGVSHGAPAHHFEDLSALLSELAAVGFTRLAERMEAVIDVPAGAAFAAENAYVGFAIENPALFSLMFRREHIDFSRPSLWQAANRAVAVLFRTRGISMTDPTLEQLGSAAATLSLVHGFAVLAIDGNFVPLLRLAPEDTSVKDLLAFALANLARP